MRLTHPNPIVIAFLFWMLPLQGQRSENTIVPPEGEYSMALGKSVVLSHGPEALHLYDLQAREDKFIPLPGVARTLSIGFRGTHAAVLLDRTIVYVDLSKLAILKTFDLAEPVQDLFLADDGVKVDLGRNVARSIDLSSGLWGSRTIAIGGVRRTAKPTINIPPPTNIPLPKSLTDNRAAAQPPRAVGVPSVVSGTPTAPNTSPQTFTFVGADSSGYSNIYRVYFLIHYDTTIPQYSCHGFYDRSSNAFALFNDTLTSLLGPLSPGGAGTIENSQCRVTGSGTSVSGAGNNLTLTMNMSLLNGYANAHNKVYLWVQNNDNVGTNWQQTGVWNPASGAAAPTISSATPTSSTIHPQVFRVTAADTNQWFDISRIYFQVGPTSSPSVDGCHGFYDRPSNLVGLYDNSLTGITYLNLSNSSEPYSIANNQCEVFKASTGIISGSSTNLVFDFHIRLTGPYALVTEGVYFLSVDNESNASAWTKTGTFGAAQQAPSILSVGPSPSYSSPQVFETRVRDNNGVIDLYRVYFLAHTSTSTVPNSCHGFYQRSDNSLYLFNDALTSVLGPLALGSGGTLSNTQCTLYGSSRIITVSVSDVRLSVAISLSSGYGNSSNPKNMYFIAQDLAAADSGWSPAVSWTHPSSGTPAALTSHSSGATLSGLTTTFVWSTGSNVSQYKLDVGTTAGGSNIGSSGPLALTTYAFTNLSYSGTIYVRLSSLINNSWQYTDYSFNGSTSLSPVWTQIMTNSSDSGPLGSTKKTYIGGTISSTTAIAVTTPQQLTTPANPGSPYLYGGAYACDDEQNCPTSPASNYGYYRHPSSLIRSNYITGISGVEFEGHFGAVSPPSGELKCVVTGQGGHALVRAVFFHTEAWYNGGDELGFALENAHTGGSSCTPVRKLSIYFSEKTNRGEEEKSLYLPITYGSDSTYQSDLVYHAWVTCPPVSGDCTLNAEVAVVGGSAIVTITKSPTALLSDASMYGSNLSLTSAAYINTILRRLANASGYVTIADTLAGAVSADSSIPTLGDQVSVNTYIQANNVKIAR